MELTIAERLVLLNIIPVEGNYVTAKILQRLRLAVGFTEEEVEKWNMVVSEEKVEWKDEAEPTNIPIGKVARAEIVKALEKVDEAGKVNAQHFTLFEKFGFDEE